MNRNGLLICYDKDLRLHVNYPEARKEITDDMVRFIRKAPGTNFVSFTFADETRLETVVDREVAYFAPMNQPLTWLVYEHDRLPNIDRALLSSGFVGEEDPAAVMVFDVNQAPESSFEAEPADIRRITDRDGLKDIVHVLDGVYGNHNDWVYGRMGAHLDIPGYLSAYAAYVDGKPVSAAWTYFPGRNFATLFGGSTLAEHRARGLYTSLLRAAQGDPCAGIPVCRGGGGIDEQTHRGEARLPTPDHGLELRVERLVPRTPRVRKSFSRIRGVYTFYRG